MKWSTSVGAGLIALLSACESQPGLLPDGGSLHGPQSFQITYNSTRNRPLLLQLGEGQRWLSVLDSTGTPLNLEPGCGGCDCEACDRCQSCTPTKLRVVQVPYARSTSWTWSGLALSAGKCGENVCAERRSASPGRYTARFCYGYASAEHEGGRVVSAPSCEDLTFDYPSADGGAVTLDVCDC